MAGHPSAQSGLYGIMIYCRVRICYVISDVNLRDVMALLHSLSVGKRLCIALIFHKGPCVRLYCIKLPQNIEASAVQRGFEEIMAQTHFV